MIGQKVATQPAASPGGMLQVLPTNIGEADGSNAAAAVQYLHSVKIAHRDI